MSAIDKIYGNKEQFSQLYSFLLVKKPKFLKYLYTESWLSEEWQTDNKQHPISNFPTKVDKWLLKYCKIDWVKDAIIEQYGDAKIVLYKTYFYIHNQMKYKYDTGIQFDLLPVLYLYKTNNNFFPRFIQIGFSWLFLHMYIEFREI